MGFTRNETRRLYVGKVPIGGGAPVAIQSMTNTKTKDVKSTVEQILKLEDDTMPKGLTRDYPKYSVRSFSLVVARKPVSMETLNSIAKEIEKEKV